MLLPRQYVSRASLEAEVQKFEREREREINKVWKCKRVFLISAFDAILSIAFYSRTQISEMCNIYM